jgi:MoaA/NifB/PqqE/SkfB family radical SAM enzyme
VRDVTVLWALRSPCSLACRYCYFGTPDEHRANPPTGLGHLSHLSRDDVPLDTIMAFLATAADSAIQRMFLAGGEPLNWLPALEIARVLKAADIEVIICTNGIPLNKPAITARIIGLGIDAVSVSLDSADPGHNDQYRPAVNGRDGWAQVLSGIRALQTARGPFPAPKIGLYSVITRANIRAITEVSELAAGLRLDYFVPQPVSLPANHALHEKLSLRPGDQDVLADTLRNLYQAELSVALPAPDYPARFTAVTATEDLLTASGCFGGHTLAFIEPDGSIWPCPSSYKIAATPPTARRTIIGHHAAELFAASRRTCPADCPLLSRDCVNMWPLTGFSRFLASGAAP